LSIYRSQSDAQVSLVFGDTIIVLLIRKDSNRPCFKHFRPLTPRYLKYLSTSKSTVVSLENSIWRSSQSSIWWHHDSFTYM